MAMKCSNLTCSAELKEDAKFCGLCGTKTPQPQSCRHCGFLNLSGAMFCGSCGKSQSEPSGVGGALSNANSLGEFIYELTEERIQTEGSKLKTQEGMGYWVYKVVNGVFADAKAPKDKAEKSEKSDGPSKGLLGNLKEIWNSWVYEPLVGEKPEEHLKRKKVTQVYVMLDFTDSPILSKTISIPLPGLPDAKLRCDFWVDPSITAEVSDVLKFKERILGTRTALSCHEFITEAAALIEQKILPSIVLETIPSNRAGTRKYISDKLLEMSGISVSCVFIEGKKTERYQLDISKSALACPSCGNTLRANANFCGKCPTNVSQLTASPKTTFLQAAGGEQLTLRLSMLIDRSLKPLSSEDMHAPEVNISDAQVSNHVISVLEPVLRRYDVSTLMRPVMLAQLSNELNDKLVKDWRGYVTEFTVVDLRTAEDEWFFNTEALLAEKLREIKTDQKNLAIEQSQIELEQSAFNLVMQRIQHQDVQELAQKRQEQNKKKQLAELDLDDHQLETSTDLRKAIITDDAEKELFDRQREKELRNQDYLREQAKAKRGDELDHVDHDMVLEKKVAQHDVDLNDLAGEAESRAKRRNVADDSFVVDEEIRLEAKRKEQLANIEQDIEDRKENRTIDKLTKLEALAAQGAQQEHEHEIQKTQQLHDQEMNLIKEANALEQKKLDAMKNLDTIGILAMQATELAKAGASADMIKAMTGSYSDSKRSEAELQSGLQIAEAKAAAAQEIADVKAAMFERILETQKEGADNAIRAHEASADRVQQSSDKAMGNMMHVSQSTAGEAKAGYKLAAEIAQSVNEKSMDSMSKVAAASAIHSNDGMKEAVQSSRIAATKTIESMANVYTAAVKATRYVCMSCHMISDEGTPHCTNCGGTEVKEQSAD
jgi:hypothetical protein